MSGKVRVSIRGGSAVEQVLLLSCTTVSICS